MGPARADPLFGFYGPDSMMWRINREAVLLGAGPAALLLRVAHARLIGPATPAGTIGLTHRRGVPRVP